MERLTPVLFIWSDVLVNGIQQGFLAGGLEMTIAGNCFWVCLIRIRPGQVQS